MTAPFIPGRTVPVGPVRRIAEALNDEGLRQIATGFEALAVPQQPETPQEHVRHAIMLFRLSLRDASGVVHVAGPDYDAAMRRLQQAVEQLEARVA